MNNRNNEVRFEIVEHIAVLEEFATGWNKELNMVSWNGGPPKYDIRDWDSAHERMSKGITLWPEEMQRLFDGIKDREILPREYNQER